MTQPPLNSVEVDVDAELAKLASIGAAADAEEERAEVEQAGHDPAAWRKAADFVVTVVDGQVCPNWGLGPADHEELSAALAAVLDHYFPGGPNGVDNWHPLWQLAFVAGAITLTRGIDWQTGQLKPMKAAPRSGGDDDGDSETAERVSHVPGGDDAQRQDGAGFTFGRG